MVESPPSSCKRQPTNYPEVFSLDTNAFELPYPRSRHMDLLYLLRTMDNSKEPKLTFRGRRPLCHRGGCNRRTISATHVPSTDPRHPPSRPSQVYRTSCAIKRVAAPPPSWTWHLPRSKPSILISPPDNHLSMWSKTNTQPQRARSNPLRSASAAMRWH